MYRPKWGNTPWTAIEAAAIKDSCLDTAFKSIFFFVIDPTNDLPTWLPETHIRFNFSDFTLDQAVGAIKMRVQEQGGRFQPLTPARMAELLKIEKKFQWDKEQMSSFEGTAKILVKVKELFEEICIQCDEANTAGNLQIRYSTNVEEGNVEQVCTLCIGRVSLVIFWYQPLENSIEKASLGAREFNECMLLPPNHVHFQTPEIIGEKRFSPDLSPAREYGWQLMQGTGGFVSSKELASKCVLQFLNLIDRDAKGQIRRKGWN